MRSLPLPPGQKSLKQSSSVSIQAKSDCSVVDFFPSCIILCQIQSTALALVLQFADRLISLFFYWLTSHHPAPGSVDIWTGPAIRLQVDFTVGLLADFAVGLPVDFTLSGTILFQAWRQLQAHCLIGSARSLSVERP